MKKRNKDQPVLPERLYRTYAAEEFLHYDDRIFSGDRSLGAVETGLAHGRNGFHESLAAAVSSGGGLRGNADCIFGDNHLYCDEEI